MAKLRMIIVRFMIVFLVIAALGAGFGVYYTNHYGYYRDVDLATISLERLDGKHDSIAVTNSVAIDSASSPLRFRACLQVPLSVAKFDMLYKPVHNPEPRIAPKRLPCFDAVAIGQALEEGRAKAYISRTNQKPGIDRIIAVFSDGRAFAWHRLGEQFRETSQKF